MVCGMAVQMNLLDRAVKLAAEQDEPEEMNFVRKHAREQVQILHTSCCTDPEMHTNGCPSYPASNQLLLHLFTLHLLIPSLNKICRLWKMHCQQCLGGGFGWNGSGLCPIHQSMACP